MTTVQIKADKVVLACQQALIDRTYKEDRWRTELGDSTNPNVILAYHHALANSVIATRWLKSMIAAAEASEGVVTMSVEDVGRIKEWLK